MLQDTGLFRTIIKRLIRLTRGQEVAVTAGTALVGVLAHLDGAGATTFLLTVPALLPLYLRLGMSRYLMLVMLAIGVGIANMLSWAGPLGRAAVTGIDVTELWQPAAQIVHAMVIGNIIGTFASPFSPALWLALGLARADIGTHLRNSFFWMWGFSLVVFGAAMALGLF